MSAHADDLTIETAAARHRGRLRTVLAISAGVFVAEIAVGVGAGSLALIADAGHVFADVTATALALGAIWLAARPITERRTYGFYRSEILAAVLNAILLFTVAGVVLVEAYRRLLEPTAVATTPVIAVALLALVANGTSAFLLRPGQRESLTLRGAYLEVLGDALGSLAVLVSAVVIAVTGFRQADPIASSVLALLILTRTWVLLRDAIDVLLEATPKDVDLATVRAHILEAPFVRAVHDLHVWTITSGRNVVSAHVVIERHADSAAVLDGLCRCLEGQFDIEHSTFQLETEDRTPLESASHP